ncbi:putative membrane protein [Mucilaginibacter yixingensis]|uniref:Putative membrane protein n=1 Tax=Mucilaginibacter yixingensis TaxID=1295612 RepID=A0A2T5J6I5_9SPHI|nr:DUF1345 domain-containing protein [Mucilaginibacter yixingensis]PTQ94150.1 putative membrane protein [Mucilaginibacter yixingensis]
MSKKQPTSIFALDAHYKVYIAVIVTAIVYFLVRSHVSNWEQVLIPWTAFAFTITALDWVIILTCHPREIRKTASLEDSHRTLIFLFVILASVASLVAILFLLKSPKSTSDAEVTRHVLLSMGAVVISWCLVHTIFTMRYAHLYYAPDEGSHKPIGGLQFPEEPAPDYLDFVYFGFVLGTTFQVSDVEISSRPIRRLALLHGLIAFAFNTAILALSINVVSGLIAH